MNNAPIGVFDSGVGGISTLGACLDMLPDESFVYLADRSGMPYGEKNSEQIAARVTECVETLKGEGVKAVMIACNTATNVGIKELREKFDMPFVGLEPALRPAVESCRRGNILVLLTPATAAREKFLALVKELDNGRIIIAPQPTLASDVERVSDDFESLRETVYSILRRYRGVEGVVLGCTHYVFLRPLIEDFYCGKIKIFDGNRGAARRLKTLLCEKDMTASDSQRFIKFMVI